MINVQSIIETYNDSKESKIKVVSDRIDSDLVILLIGKESVTVIARELKTAIDNATNTGF